MAKKGWQNSRIFYYLSGCLAVATACLGLAYEAKFCTNPLRRELETENRQERLYVSADGKNIQTIRKKFYVLGGIALESILYSLEGKVLRR